MSFPRGVVAWINFSPVIPRLDRGIQLKTLKLLVLKVVFLDTLIKPRYDTEDLFQSTQQPLPAKSGIQKNKHKSNKFF
ncbi:hypothetical protein A8V33_01615 [Rickettsia sp. wb]|nr:hypothetical protein A8V33_01615 [Rickettsia sp. wb]ODA38024.1 hypothetical protein A8V34_02260 [Rickettsia sp. wq]